MWVCRLETISFWKGKGLQPGTLVSLEMKEWPHISERQPQIVVGTTAATSAATPGTGRDRQIWLMCCTCSDQPDALAADTQWPCYKDGVTPPLVRSHLGSWPLWHLRWPKLYNKPCLDRRDLGGKENNFNCLCLSVVIHRIQTKCYLFNY